MRRLTPIVLTTLGAFVAATPAQAGEWKNTIAPYLWAAGLDGKAAIGSVETDVDVSFGDLLSNLSIGGMLAYRGEGERWIIMADAIYMDLGGDKSRDTGPVRIDGSANVTQTMLEGDVGYRLTDRIFAYAGLRYNDLDMDLDVVTTGPGPGQRRSAGKSESWVDPVIGAVVDFPLAEKWTAALRGDVGGFGVGSDFAWEAMASVRWQATPSLGVVGAYRYMDVDYDTGSGASYFKYDMAMSGPALGVMFSF